MTDSKSIVKFINDYASWFGRLSRMNLPFDEIQKRVAKALQSPEAFGENLANHIEYEKAKAVQDYLLTRCSNDEVVNELVRKLKRKLK